MFRKNNPEVEKEQCRALGKHSGGLRHVCDYYEWETGSAGKT